MSEVKIPRGTVSAAMKRDVVKALNNESKAIGHLNDSRLALCIALGKVRKAIELVESLKRGGFAAWVRSELAGRLSESAARKYSKVGMAENPEEAFEEFKSRDLAARAKADAKRDAKIAAAAKAAVSDEPKPDEPKPDEPKPDEPKPDEPKPDEPKPDEPKPDEPKLKRHDSDAGDDRAVPPSVADLFSQMDSALRELVRRAGTGDAAAVAAIRTHGARVAGIIPHLPNADTDDDMATKVTVPKAKRSRAAKSVAQAAARAGN